MKVWKDSILAVGTATPTCTASRPLQFHKRRLDSIEEDGNHLIEMNADAGNLTNSCPTAALTSTIVIVRCVG